MYTLTPLQNNVLNIIIGKQQPSIELDDMSFYALCYCDEVKLLMMLKNIYPQITFNVDLKGNVVYYSMNSAQIKSARKI